MKIFRFKSKYFVFLFFALIAVAGIISLYNFSSIPDVNNEADNLIDISYNDLEDSISKDGIAYVFFYYDDSALCDRMEANLRQFAQQGMDNVRFFRLNLSKYLGKLDKYDFNPQKSARPYIHIYSDSKKVKQIAGVVSKSNLEMIHQRVLRNSVSVNN